MNGAPALVGPLPADLAGLDRAGILAALEAEKARTDRAYWTFTRCARGNPVAMCSALVPWLREAQRRLRGLS